MRDNIKDILNLVKLNKFKEAQIKCEGIYIRFIKIVKFLHSAPAVFITGLLPPPEIIISSVLSGIPADQFPALFQSVLTEPVQAVAILKLALD